MKCSTCGICIKEHPANNCLNRWVAEKVMGWEVYLTGRDYVLAGMPHGGDYDINIEHPAYYDPRFKDAHVIPNFSESIAAAWPLVEKFGLTITPHTVRDLWLVDTELRGDYELWLAYGKTAPLAICRAVLLEIQNNQEKEE